MQIFNADRERIGILTGFKDRIITTTLSTGDKELTFKYPAHGELVDLLQEESYIRTRTDEYVLKAVEISSEWNKYTAQLNVEELEGAAFSFGFLSQEQTIEVCLNTAFEGTGWTVGICTVQKKRTIKIESATYAWNILQKCLDTYRCECQIDSLHKIVNIYETIGQDRGCYFVEGLNLRKLTLNSDTYDFFTRIVPVGKDGLTIEAAVGKQYLENHQYSKKIKTYTWKDDRYTNVESLIEDATAKLDELSKPYRAYSADVVDLAKLSELYSNIFDYKIGDSVTFISKSTKTREKQRIVKIVEYPEKPEKNTVELSNLRKTFAQIQREDTDAAKNEAILISEKGMRETLEDYQTKAEYDIRRKEYEDRVIQEVEKKVDSKSIISTINQSAEEIQIRAEKVKFKGVLTVEDFAEDQDIVTSQQVTKITKDTVDTEYINSLKVKAGSVDAEDLTGEKITGKKFLTKRRTKIDEDEVGLYIGDDGFDFCWDASNGFLENAFGHLRMTEGAMKFLINGETLLECSANTRVNGGSVGSHVVIPRILYKELLQAE